MMPSLTENLRELCQKCSDNFRNWLKIKEKIAVSKMRTAGSQRWHTYWQGYTEAIRDIIDEVESK